MKYVVRWRSRFKRLARQWLPLEAADVGITGSGSLVSQNSALDGEGVSLSTGAGALAAQASQAAGAGLSESTGTGALLAQASDVNGAGLTQWVATGALLAQAAALAGAGITESRGTGALNSQDASLDGVGEVVADEITGIGALVSGDSTMLGLGELAPLEVQIQGARRPRFLTRIKNLFYWYDDESELPKEEPVIARAAPVDRPVVLAREIPEPEIAEFAGESIGEIETAERAEIAKRAMIKRNNEAIMMLMH